MESFRDIFNNISIGIIVISKDFEIEFANKKSEYIFNAKIPIGEKCYKFFNNNESICEDCPIENKEFNTIIYKEAKSLRKKFTYKVINCRNNYIKEIFDLNQFFELFEDVIEEKKYAEVGHISAAIAHHVNNLLMGISGRVEAISILRNENKLNDEYFNKTIIKINDDISSIKKLMNEILFFAHPEKIKKKKNDLNNIIRDFYLFSKYEIERPQVKLKLNLDKNIPEIEIEEKLIQHLLLVICRLLSKNFYNIEKDNKSITIDTCIENDNVLIKIRDNNITKCEKIEKILTTKKEISYDNYVINYCLLFLNADIIYNFQENKGNIVKIVFNEK